MKGWFFVLFGEFISMGNRLCWLAAGIREYVLSDVIWECAAITIQTKMSSLFRQIGFKEWQMNFSMHNFSTEYSRRNQELGQRSLSALINCTAKFFSTNNKITRVERKYVIEKEMTQKWSPSYRGDSWRKTQLRLFAVKKKHHSLLNSSNKTPICCDNHWNSPNMA